jgi:hypothetical protein
MPVHQRTGWRKARHHRRPAVQLNVELLEQRTLLSATAWPGLTNPVLEVEPNDTVAVAQALGDLTVSGSTQVAGTISSSVAADVDWYTFTLDQAAEVTVQAHAQTAGGAAPVISLNNTDSFNDPQDLVGHRMLAQSGGPGDPWIDRAVGPGTYFVAVSGAGNRYFNPNLADSGESGGTGDYGLIVSANTLAADPSGLPTVLSTDVTAGPTPDVTAARSPLEIHVNLSGPLDPALAFNPADMNVTLTAASDPSGTNLVGSVTFSTDANDLLVTPTGPLAPDTYTLTVAANSISGVAALPQDYTTTFTVSGVEGQTQADDTPATAHELGDVTSAGLVQQAGAIGDDPAYNLANADPTLSNPASDVDLYHFQVSGSGSYALIAEVFAGRLGSALDPALTLFRKDPGSGQLVFVAVNDNTTNPTQDANGNIPLFYDAALFSGLTAGDYYLAVSGSGNAPDPANGIDPGTGGVFDPNVSHSGTMGFTTGEYVLNVLVHADGPAPQVVSATPADQDTLTAPPTQLTFTFNVPVNLEQLSYQSYQQSGGASGQMPAVFIQAADGSTVYPRLESYDTSTNTATFLLLSALPNGTNELHLSAAGGLADLAGTPLAGNDPSGDYVIRFTVNGPQRGTLDPGPGPTKGLYVWHDQEPNDTAAQPQNLGVLFPSELQTGTALVRDFTSNPSAAPSDTADYYQFTVLQSRLYSFNLSGSGLPKGATPVIVNMANGKTVWTTGPSSYLRLANLDPGTYQVYIGGWTAAQAASAKYTLKITMSGSVENPTPLTAGPAPAFRIRLPDPPQSPPPQSPPPVSPPPSGSGTGSNPTPPTAGGSGSGSQPGSGQVSSGSSGSGSQQGQTPPSTPPATQTPPVVAQTPPSTTTTQEPVSMGPAAPTGPLRLVLPPSSGDVSPSRVVQASSSSSSSDAGKAPLIVLRLHAADEATASPNLPSGALLQFNVAALGGVRATEQLSLLTGPPRLNLPQPEVVNSDPTLWLAQVPTVGGEEVVERLLLGGGWDNPANPSGGPAFPGSWLFWSMNPLIWGWITSPLVPSLPLAESVPDGPEEAEPTAPAQQTGADDTFGVNSSWAGALLAAGLLSVPKTDQERNPHPVRATSRRRGQPDTAIG